MKQMSDRKSLRREYLRCRRKAQVRFVTALFKVVLWPLVGLFLAGWAMVQFMQNPMGDDRLSYMSLLVLYLVSSLPLILYYRIHYIETKSRLRALPYISFENADTLPVDEILVRAAEKPPTAQSEVLLRAAQKGQAKAKEELLHVAQE